MKKIIGLLVIFFTIICGHCNISNADLVDDDYKDTTNIDVAICNANTVGWSSYQYFVDILDSYEWKIGNNNPYKFALNMTSFDDLVQGNFMENDVYIHAAVLDQDFRCGIFPNSENNVDLINNIKDFIKNGGSYIGTCGGSTFALHPYETPDTFVEWMGLNSGFVDDSWVAFDANYGIPIISEYFYMRYFPMLDRYKFTICDWDSPLYPNRENPDPTRVGTYGLVWYPGMNPESDSYYVSGATNRLKITKSNYPPFNDYLEDYLDVHWCGGPTFKVPSGSNVSVLSCYSGGGLDGDDSTNIEAWSYDHPETFNLWADFLSYFRDDFCLFKNLSFLGALQNSTFKLRDFNQTSDEIETKIGQNDPSHIMFNYPNKDGGKVILWGPHPEMEFWEKDGSYAENVDEDTEYNNTLWEGLIRWKNDNGTPSNPDDDYNLTKEDVSYNTSWIVRREVAWASNRVEDDKHLPPVYGRSQVVDFDPPMTEDEEFNIDCCVGGYEEDWEKDINLTLYYRYNGSGSSWQWTNWNDSGLYITDNGGPFTFSFNAIYGDGRYEFYSILNATDQDGYSLETPPPDGDGDGEPDADSWVLVGGPIIADFNFTKGAPLVNETVTFYDQSFTINELLYSNWTWQCGDQNGSQMCEYPQTHCYYPEINTSFRNNENATILLWVQDTLGNTAQITKTITVRNNPPEAGFYSSEEVVKPGDSITCFDDSTDPDGTIESRKWDFGDPDGNGGGFVGSNQLNISHTYNNSGIYTITLTTTDSDDDEDTITKEVIVADSYVDDDFPTQGLDNNWSSIQDCIDNSSTFDLIYIYNGTYDENVTVNKSLSLIGEHKEGVIIDGSVEMTNPFDYELPDYDSIDWILYFNMSKNDLLLHLNNDSDVGENYSSSDAIYDYSKSENNGTKYNVILSDDTPKGEGCFEFDGISSSINFSSVNSLTNQNITVSAWIYWQGGTGDKDPIVSQLDADQGYSLFIDTSTAKPVFSLNEIEITSEDPLSEGWHHIAGIHNSTTLSIFVDGTLVNSTYKTGYGSDSICYIGHDGSEDHFYGKIDEISIWNRSLSSEEIFDIYNGNFGVYAQGFTISTPYVGLIPSNHSEIIWCDVTGSSTAVKINNLEDININYCNMYNGENGVLISNCNPDQYRKIRITDSNITNFINCSIVDSSSYVSFVGVNVNGSNINLSFEDSDFGTIVIAGSTSTDNVAPDTPYLSGPTEGDLNTSYTYYTCTNDSNYDQIQYLFDWDDGNTTGWLYLYDSNDHVNASHSFSEHGGYYVTVKAKDVFNNESEEESILFRTEQYPPVIENVTDSPDTVGFGQTVNISWDCYDNLSGIYEININVSYPDGTDVNYSYYRKTMGNESSDYHYNFYNTWLCGQYNYTIWVVDGAYNTNFSTGHSFNVSADATIGIATLQDAYGAGEYINITDPPTPPEDYYLTERGLDYNKYYNAISGNDVLEIFTGPVNYLEGGEWTPIDNTLEVLDQQHPAYEYGYRAGNEKGLYSTYFKPNIQSDWPVAFAYDRSDDPTTDVLRTKLVGVGYLDPTSDWDYEYLQGVLDSQGYIEDYSAIYEDVFTGTDVKWSYGNSGMKEEIILSEDARTMLENNPPSAYGLSNDDSYLVFITRLDYQNLEMHDSSGSLEGNFTLTDAGIDFKDALGYFKCALPLGDAYELENELNRTKLTYRIIQYNGNNYLLSGLKLEDLEEMQFPVVVDPTLTVKSSTNDGYILNGGNTYSTVQSASTGTVYDGSDYLYIGQRYAPFGKYLYDIYRSFLYFNTSSLPSNIVINSSTVSLYCYSDVSSADFDIVIQNGQPIFPRNPLESADYNKNYYAGNGGSINTTSLANGRSNITLTNHDWINQDGITKLCLRSSKDINAVQPSTSEYVVFYSREKTGFDNYNPYITIEYRNQSKIKNVGSTNISGYLLMQVQYNDSGDWIVDNDAINETNPRTINSSDQLALDLIFNGEVSTSDLTNGDGQYRVYAAFRDPDGEPLICDDESALEAWYEFEVSTT